MRKVWSVLGILLVVALLGSLIATVVLAQGPTARGGVTDNRQGYGACGGAGCDMAGAFCQGAGGFVDQDGDGVCDNLIDENGDGVCDLGRADCVKGDKVCDGVRANAPVAGSSMPCGRGGFAGGCPMGGRR